jgi:predicted nucleic acid-binding protein
VEAAGAALLLIDARAGVTAPKALGLPATGKLGVLMRAAQRGFAHLRPAFARLRRTDFRYRPELLAALLAKREASEL